MTEHHALVEVTGGVDTHKDTHVAAAKDALGRVLGTLRRLRRRRRGSPRYGRGCPGGAAWSRSGWKAPALTALGWLAT